MKTGKSLSELAQEIERQAATKRDYLADTREIRMASDAQGLVVAEQPMGMTEHAHRQLAERLQIPARYYERLRKDHPGLLAGDVNHLMHEEPERRLIRTLDGNVRAYLSDRYQRIDNLPVAETVLPVLRDIPGIEIVSAEITERKLYIKAVTHSVRAEIKSLRKGDVVEAGVMISNSEIGLGMIQVDPFANFLACLNGMVLPKRGMRKAHVGTRLDADEGIVELLADDTKRVMDQAVLLKVRDVVRAALDGVKFRTWIDELQATTEQRVRSPVAAIEVLANDQQFTGEERGSVLRHLIEGGDLSRYGLINAVTRTAEDAHSYDRATELETLGGRLVDLAPAEWQRIGEAE